MIKEAAMNSKILEIAETAARSFRMNDPAIELEDLRQEARIAAIRAAKTYDPSKVKSPDASLEAWVWHNVFKSVARFLNRRHRPPATVQYEDAFQMVTVPQKYIMERFDAIEQRAINYAIELFESGEYRTRIRAKVKEKFGKQTFYKIKQKLEE